MMELSKKDKAKAYYAANREKILAKCKLYRETNTEKISAKDRSRYRKNIEKVKRRQKAWRQSNIEVRKAAEQLYREQNRSKVREVNKNWSKQNKDKRNALTMKRLAKKLKATPSWMARADFAAIEEWYTLAKELQWLSEEPLHVDHIIPLQGKEVCGLHIAANLQILPASYNSKKGNKL